MTAIVLDLLVMVMLGVTIGYAIKLNGKLNIIKNQKLEFANDIKTFNEATESAIIAVEELHVKGEEVCRMIDEKIRRAQLIGDEIEFMLERATKKLAALKYSEVKPVAAPKAQVGYSAVNSVAEAQLLKVMRDREFKEALNG